MTTAGRRTAREKNTDLSEELVRMAEEYRAVRAALATDGSGIENYHPMMAKLQRRNAGRLNEIMDEVGWPGRELIGGASWARPLRIWAPSIEWETIAMVGG